MSRGSGALEALRAALSEPALLRVQLAWAVAHAALWGWLATISAVTFELGGPLAVGTALALRQVAGGLAAPFATVLARRWGRLDALIGAAALRAAAMGAGAIVLQVGLPPPFLYALIVLEGLGSGPLQPLQSRVLPWLVRSPAQLAAANGVSELLRAAGFLLGPALSMGVLLLSSPGTVFWMWSAALSASALLLAAARGHEPPARAGPAESVPKEVASGFRTTLADEGARTLVGALAAAGLATGALQVYATSLAIERLGLGPSGPSMLFAMVGLGGLAGGLASLSLAGRRDLASPLALGLLCVGLAALAMGAYPSLPVVLASLAVGGAALVANRVAATTLLQRAVEVSSHASVLGTNGLLQFLAVGAGGLAGSALAEWLSIRGALVVTSVLLAALALVSWPRLRRIAAASVVHQRELEVLQRTRLFGLLPVGPLEQLAGRLKLVEAPPGTEIVREHEDGSQCFVVGRGSVEVVIGARRVRQLGEGDIFGEISVLQGVPRTATVVALEPTELWCIPGSDFLEAVGGTRESLTLATSIASERLHGSE